MFVNENVVNIKCAINFFLSVFIQTLYKFTKQLNTYINNL